MPIRLPSDAPTILIKKEAFDRSGLTRADIDAALTLTAEEFAVEGGLIVVGPLHDDDAPGALVDALEGRGLIYFDDFFEMSGSWPVWCAVFAMARGTTTT
ncbi:MAG: hypothetical protein K2X99_00570 [Gemmatimonadaceae bacterium]|nr:hypothetical protein [Gemmatimonadaceae bacterium]